MGGQMWDLSLEAEVKKVIKELDGLASLQQAKLGLLPKPCAENISSALCQTDKIASYLKENWPYRRAHCRWTGLPYRAHSSWAGGLHFVNVYLAEFHELEAHGNSEKGWSKNLEWTGNNSHAIIRCSARAIQYMPNLMSGNRIYLDVYPQGGQYCALEVQQSRGFSLKTKWVILTHI